jgi:hypothetical protein
MDCPARDGGAGERKVGGRAGVVHAPQGVGATREVVALDVDEEDAPSHGVTLPVRRRALTWSSRLERLRASTIRR